MVQAVPLVITAAAASGARGLAANLNTHYQPLSQQPVPSLRVQPRPNDSLTDHFRSINRHRGSFSICWETGVKDYSDAAPLRRTHDKRMLIWSTTIANPHATHRADLPLNDLPLYVQRIPQPLTQTALPAARPAAVHPAPNPTPHPTTHENPTRSEWTLPLFEQRRQLPRPDVPASLSIAITNKAPHELSRSTLTVIDLLLSGDLLRLRSEEVADTLHISPTTLRRRLRADGTHYQSILDHIRRHRCTLQLEKRWLPGKCVAWELGYAEVNSFYRAFRRWTGHNYSDLKRLYL